MTQEKAYSSNIPETGRIAIPRDELVILLARRMTNKALQIMGENRRCDIDAQAMHELADYMIESKMVTEETMFGMDNDL